MDNGGYKFIYVDHPWSLLDETEYFAVNYNYKQIAAFKTKDLALEYILWKKKQ
jgi:hypothetical protein